jgi:hypothetical protein
MDNPEKLATRRKQTKQKYNIICVGHHNTQVNTHSINRTLLQTTGGKNYSDWMLLEHETDVALKCFMIIKHDA